MSLKMKHQLNSSTQLATGRVVSPFEIIKGAYFENTDDYTDGACNERYTQRLKQAPGK
jgi:hypothetical protein